MKSKVFYWTTRAIAVVVLAAGIGARAEILPYTEYCGVVNAHSPQTAATATAAANGPYEIHGTWCLKLNRYTGRADFTAALNMERSDGWALTLNSGNFDPSLRDPHTHHITLLNAVAKQSKTSTGSQIIQVSGQAATVTLNGSAAPVSPTPLVIEITGGTEVEFSNMTMTFGSPGSKHFGSLPLLGVVRVVRDER